MTLIKAIVAVTCMYTMSCMATKVTKYLETSQSLLEMKVLTHSCDIPHVQARAEPNMLGN